MFSCNGKTASNSCTMNGRGPFESRAWCLVTFRCLGTGIEGDAGTLTCRSERERERDAASDKSGQLDVGPGIKNRADYAGCG